MVKSHAFYFTLERKRMKRLTIFLAVVMLISAIAEPLSVTAAGDPDMDSGGGTWGHAVEGFTWRDGDDGVRVTIIDASTGNPVSRSIDISNIDTSDIVLHFGKVSKSAYRNGTTLNAIADNYVKYTPAVPLPKLVNAPDREEALRQIKAYFTDEQVLRRVAKHVGMDFDYMISGQFKVLVEPMAYAEINGVRTALTATEAALYNAQTGGLIRRKMSSLTHKNLPLSLFLERDDAGFRAWTGSKTDKVKDEDIIPYLGLGTVRFTDEIGTTETVEYLDAPDYVYHTDTYVITCVTVSGGKADPSNPASVCFHILGQDYWATNIYYPEGGQQMAWVCWKTPSTPQRVNITVSSGRTISKTTIKANVVSLQDNPPPNPVADDVNPGWNPSLAISPGQLERKSASWTLWKCYWHENLKWEANWQWVNTGHLPTCKRNCKKKHGHWEDQGEWHDYGWWEHYLEYCSATMYGSMNLSPDETSPTDYGDVTKSGYGVKVYVTGDLYFSGTPYATGVQHAIAYFPEFYYGTYWRLLDHDGSGHFTFKANPYSTLGNKVHFTPIWFPDGTYLACTWMLDAWTPAGMLCGTVWDSVTINGNLWDDWHVAPENPD
jgi:hypothetical protein